MSGTFIRVFALVALVFGVLAPAASKPAAALSPNIVVSQVFGGGGNGGSVYTNDFIELFNRGTSAVSINGWSVQYASKTGSNWNATNITGTIPAGGYYLVQEGSGGPNGTTPLPTADITGTLSMGGSDGKVALVNSTDLLTGAGPTGPTIVDFVGYGSAGTFEGAGPTAGLSATDSAQRNNHGCTETDSNVADFTVLAAAPRNSATALAPCGGSGPQPIVPTCGGSITTSEGTQVNRTIRASDNDSTTITATLTVSPTANITLSGVVTSTGQYTGTLTVNADVPIGTYTAVLNFDNEDSEPASCTISITVQGPQPITHIHTIQGAAHISPLNGQLVSNVQGIVTAVKNNSFYMQDDAPDNDPATSEAILVFTSSAPTVAVGDRVQVAGTVAEYRPGSTGLTITQISTPGRVVTKLSGGNPLPAATIIGNGGRIPPNQIIENDATNVEANGTFDPNEDGIDFYESLESMYVQVNNAVVVGPTNNFGEIVVLADNGANATQRTPRGGIITLEDDFNPERIMIDDVLLPTPAADVKDSFTTPILGVMDYSFNNFKVAVTTALTAVDGGLQREVTDALSSANEISIGGFNVENLDPNDPQVSFDRLGGYIVSNLLAPDIVAVQEIQDNNGATNDSVVDASQTYTKLINAILAQGGPTYEFRDIAPVDDQDGGEPGGNIRVGFLFRTDRGVSFVDRAGGTATNAVSVLTDGSGPYLSFSPGRIDPTSSAWASSRKPLAAEFSFQGQRIFVINNHFNSKGGDQPLYGFNQPPVRSSEVQRHQQAAIVNSFVDQLVAADADAKVVVLGDLNDFQFSETLNILKDNVLVDLIETLPITEQYTYVYEGNSQVLDHILVSNGLFENIGVQYDVVHVNAEFSDQASDHEPEVVRLDFSPAASAADFSGSTKSVDAVDVASGSLITYTLTLSNSGDLGATFALTDVLDANFELVDAGSFAMNGQTLTLTGTLAGRTSQSFAFTVRVNRSFTGEITNTATLSGDGTTRTLTAPTVTVTRYSLFLPLVIK